MERLIKKIKILILILTLFIISIINLFSSFEDNLRQMLSQAISDPSRFVYEIQNNYEITLPVSPGKKYNFNSGLFPGFFPFTYSNVSINYNLYKEDEFKTGIPQIDIIAGGGYLFGGKIMANQTSYIDSAVFYGYHTGFILSSSLSSKTRIFYGYKYSHTKAKLELNKSRTYELIGVRIDSFNSEFNENTIVFGVETLKNIDKRWAIQFNYGFTNNTIATKLSWYGKWFELGINIYPEGVIVIYPVWNMRLNF